MLLRGQRDRSWLRGRGHETTKQELRPEGGSGQVAKGLGHRVHTKDRMRFASQVAAWRTS